MAYLNGPASKTDYGVVEIGGNILVDSNGVISIPQDINANASVIFAYMTITSDASISYATISLLDADIATITSLSAVNASITSASITSLTAENETVTNNLTVGGTLSLTSNTQSTSTATGALVIAGGVGVAGNVYAGHLFDDGNRVVTSITPQVGVGLALSDVTTLGPNAEFTVTNTGVLSLIAGTGITLSASTGNITVSSTGTTFINVIQTLGPTYTATLSDNYIGVYSAAAVTVNLPEGVNGRQYSIKDEYGQGSGKITVKPNGAEKIDNANTYIISVPLASITVVYRGGGSAPGWHII